MFSKVLYIANVIGQLFVLNSVLATDFNIYGFEALDYWSKGKEWTESPGVAFPRVTFCDFNIRRLGNIHRYTVQCTLPLNMYNEKIFTFLWFWMVFVAFASCLDLVQWLIRYFMESDKVLFLFNHLRNLEKINKGSDEREAVQKFYERCLRQDGVFLLRLIGHNTNNIVVSDITGALWDRWQEFLQRKQEREAENMPVDDESMEAIQMTEKQKLAMA